MSDSNSPVIRHYGVKGMQWGVRKEAIQVARGRQAGLDRNVSRAKSAYYKETSAKGKAAALEALTKADKESWANQRTAATLTRGEQAFTTLVLASGLFTLPAAGVLGYSAVKGRNRQTYKPRYNEETLSKLKR